MQTIFANSKQYNNSFVMQWLSWICHANQACIKQLIQYTLLQIFQQMSYADYFMGTV